ncbi:MAG: glutaredoxin family protein [Acidobacteria bacterium]|nr:glutaredoxin family protein [Acidobacteriota bacterium]
MKSYLSERGIEFEDRDIRAHPQYVQDLVDQYNSRATPTVVIGEQVIIGLDPERIEQALRE